MVFDSPGGEVGGLFDLADLIQGSRGKKPVYASVAESAFSAAYAIASACDRIFLTRTAGVGSIGVFTMHVDISKMDEKEGVACTYIFAGAKKVDGNPHEPLSSDAKDTIQAEIDRTYDLFVNTVARNRKLTAKKVKSTEAGLYFGEEGVESGLADQVGTVAEAVSALGTAIEQSEQSLRAAEAANLKKAEVNEVKKPEAAAQKAADKEKCDDYMEDGKSSKSSEAKAEDPDQEEEDEEEDEEDGKDKKKAAAAPDPKEIAMLCRLAGRTDLLSDFIEKGASIAEVRKTLLAVKKEEEKRPGSIGHHVPPVGGPNPVDQLDSLAKSRAASKGISYSQAYAEVMKENPKLYTDYLDRKDAAIAAGAK